MWIHKITLHIQKSLRNTNFDSIMVKIKLYVDYSEIPQLQIDVQI